MGSISLTFIDAESGVISEAFKIADKDMKRIYSALKQSYEEINNHPDTEEDRRLQFFPHDIVRTLAKGFISDVIENVKTTELQIEQRKIEIEDISLEVGI